MPVSSMLRRVAALLAVVAFPAGWATVEVGHNHAHQAITGQDHHLAAESSGSANQGDSRLDAEGSGPHHRHVNLAATAPRNGPQEIIVQPAQASEGLTLPGSGRVLRVDSPASPPPPRARGSPFSPPSRGPPVS